MQEPSRNSSIVHQLQPFSLDPSLNAFHDHGPLPLQRLLVPLPSFLLTVREPGTCMILQQSVLLAKFAIAKTAITHNALRILFAVLEGAFVFLGRAAAKWQRYIQGGVWGNGEGGE